jgi:hypothetical protein
MGVCFRDQRLAVGDPKATIASVRFLPIRSSQCHLPRELSKHARSIHSIGDLLDDS